MSEPEQERLINTIKDALGQVTLPGVKKLEIKQFYEADKNYGTRVANALGMNIADIISD